MRPQILFGLALFAATSAVAQEPKLDDMRSWPIAAPLPARELAFCAWTNDRSTAMRIIQQHVDQDGSGDPPTYRFRRTDFAACGGEAAIALVVADPMQVPGLLTKIWISQTARCVAKATRLDMKALRGRLLALPEAKKLKALGNDDVVLAGVATLETFPIEIRQALEKCDPELTRVIGKDRLFAARFFRELEFEVARNA